MVYGTQPRSFTYVTDVVNAILKLIEIKPSKQRIDISGNKVVSVNEIVSICENVVGKKALVQFVPTPIGDQERTIGNIDQAENILGISQYTNIEFGIQEQFKQLKGDLVS